MAVDVFLGLGTNMGDKNQNLADAIKHIESLIGAVVRQSGFLCTEPWGFVSENAFLNAVVEVTTGMSPAELLNATQKIERMMGRTKKSVDGVYADRLIDIDILLYGDEIIDTPRLKVPHPLMCKRLFVMQPLAEIAPGKMFPGTDKSIKDILDSIR